MQYLQEKSNCQTSCYGYKAIFRKWLHEDWNSLTSPKFLSTDCSVEAEGILSKLAKCTQCPLFMGTQHTTPQRFMNVMHGFSKFSGSQAKEMKRIFSCCHLDINKHQPKPLLKGRFECEKSCNCLEETFTLQRKSSKIVYLIINW